MSRHLCLAPCSTKGDEKKKFGGGRGGAKEKNYKERSEEVKSLSRVQLFSTPQTVAYHALLSMGFSRQEYWNGLPFPSPEDLPNPGIKPRSPTLKADALSSEPPGKSSMRREKRTI